MTFSVRVLNVYTHEIAWLLNILQRWNRKRNIYSILRGRCLLSLYVCRVCVPVCIDLLLVLLVYSRPHAHEVFHSSRKHYNTFVIMLLIVVVQQYL